MGKIFIALVIAMLAAGCEGGVDVSTTEAITTTPPTAQASATRRSARATGRVPDPGLRLGRRM